MSSRPDKHDGSNMDTTGPKKTKKDIRKKDGEDGKVTSGNKTKLSPAKNNEEKKTRKSQHTEEKEKMNKKKKLGHNDGKMEKEGNKKKRSSNKSNMGKSKDKSTSKNPKKTDKKNNKKDDEDDEEDFDVTIASLRKNVSGEKKIDKDAKLKMATEDLDEKIGEDEDLSDIKSDSSSDSDKEESSGDKDMLDKMHPDKIQCTMKKCNLNKYFSLFCVIVSSSDDDDDFHCDFMLPYCLDGGKTTDMTVHGVFLKKETNVLNPNPEDVVDINQNYFGLYKIQHPKTVSYSSIKAEDVTILMSRLKGDTLHPYNNAMSPVENLVEWLCKLESEKKDNGWDYLYQKMFPTSNSLPDFSDITYANGVVKSCNKWMRNNTNIVFLPYSCHAKYIRSMVEYFGIDEEEFVHKKVTSLCADQVQLKLGYVSDRHSSQILVQAVKNHVLEIFKVNTQKSYDDYTFNM